tara:strand:- start:413 stop:547 length:135 start_codon:yes stop_codon:yes gene_type:complete
MNHTQESKQNCQSDKLWFQISNYPRDWLSEKSVKIIKRIIKNKK